VPAFFVAVLRLVESRRRRAGEVPGGLASEPISGE